MALKPAADGPRQPRPQRRHFKKPALGRLPGPSSHTGRSEAPENSETSPREKGNPGLPVLLTDGSTHLERTVGSEPGPLCRNAQRQVGSSTPTDANQDASARARGRGGGEWGQRSTVQMICVLPQNLEFADRTPFSCTFIVFVRVHECLVGWVHGVILTKIKALRRSSYILSHNAPASAFGK